MINWESGQVIEGEYINSGMFVEVNGNMLPVMMPKIEGNTPVSAENLRDVSNLAGFIQAYGGKVAPEGWLMCDGSAVSRTTYADLFAVIGTAYGIGDGSTTFNLPNLGGKVPVGLDSNDTDFEDLGQTGGEKTHTLTVEQIPPHWHTNEHHVVSNSAKNYRIWESDIASGSGNTYLATADTNSTGGGQEHNNMQPYTVVNYIIKI
jgi:microcystin-dependent protein